MSSSAPLLELSSLPEELPVSDELDPLLLLICSIISTSALSSMTSKHTFHIRNYSGDKFPSLSIL